MTTTTAATIEKSSDHQMTEEQLLASRGQAPAPEPGVSGGKPVLILINPHSGRGRSMKIFKKQVEQILTAHHVAHDVFVTTGDMRIKEYLDSRSLDQLSSYKALVVVSGDGLLYETVNALMARADWQEAMRIPIGLVPTGSGNGLAHTLINLSRATVKTHTDAVRVCSEQAIGGASCASDLVKITFNNSNKNSNNNNDNDNNDSNNSGNQQQQQPDKTSLYSFLSIGWGLLANIDIDSEWLRCLGEFRFTLYGVLKSFLATSHRGRLSYVLAPAAATAADAAAHNGNAQQAHQELRARLARESNADASMYKDDNHHDEEQAKLDQNAEWIHIEDRFTCLYAVHQPYVNSSTNFSPRSTLADQVTYLTYIRGRLNAYQAIKFLLAIEDGSHEQLPFVRVVPVSLFKFQPLERTKVVVDGETIPWDVSQGPLRCEVLPNILKLAWSL